MFRVNVVAWNGSRYADVGDSVVVKAADNHEACIVALADFANRGVNADAVRVEAA